MGGVFFSYRLSDHSAMFFNSGATLLDCATTENIVTDGMPLRNNGHISFWSPNLVLQEYGISGLKVESIERDTRTYSNGLCVVEYLSIVANKE